MLSRKELLSEVNSVVHFVCVHYIYIYINLYIGNMYVHIYVYLLMCDMQKNRENKYKA